MSFAEFIPKVEGFAPLPSAVADSFMAMQGGHMAIYFGGYYKFATRLVDSQDNTTFNKMKANPKLVTELLKPHYDEITRQFHEHVAQSADIIQALVITKAYDLEILKIHQNVKLILSLPKAYYDAIISHQNKMGGGDSQSPFPEGVTGYINGKVQCAEGYRVNTNKNTCVLRKTEEQKQTASDDAGSKQNENTQQRVEDQATLITEANKVENPKLKELAVILTTIGYHLRNARGYKDGLKKATQPSAVKDLKNRMASSTKQAQEWQAKLKTFWRKNPELKRKYG